MNYSADRNNPWVFPRNEIGRIHCYISWILPNKKKVTKRNFQSQEMFKQTQQVRPNCIIQDLLDFFQSTITITKTF